MKYNPQIHHRRSIRLKGYDYSQAGAYFITICCQDKKCRLEIWSAHTNHWLQMNAWIFTKWKIKQWGNYGNAISMNTLLEMKNHIKRFPITLLIILQTGKMINFFLNDSLSVRLTSDAANAVGDFI
jgi:hypothetical protein